MLRKEYQIQKKQKPLEEKPSEENIIMKLMKENHGISERKIDTMIWRGKRYSQERRVFYNALVVDLEKGNLRSD